MEIVMLRVKPQMSDGDYSVKMSERKLSSDGSALLPDATPMAPPLGYIKQPSITERIRAMVQSEHLRRAAEAAGAETFEEANDFEVGDDFDPSSPYEDEFDPRNPDADGVESTGVPSPGGGEGAGGPIGASPVAAAPASAPKAPAAEPPAAGAPKAS